MDAPVPPPPPGVPPCPPRGTPGAAPRARAPVPFAEALHDELCRRAAREHAAMARPPPPQDIPAFDVYLVTPSGEPYMFLGEWPRERLQDFYVGEFLSEARILYPLPTGWPSVIRPLNSAGPLQWWIPGTRRIEIVTYQSTMSDLDLCTMLFKQAGSAPLSLCTNTGRASPFSLDLDLDDYPDMAWAHHVMSTVGFSPLVCGLHVLELTRRNAPPPLRRLYTAIPREIGLGPWVFTLRELVLPHHGFTGRIPPEIALLSALRVLDLSDNRLEGALPPRLGVAQPDLAVVDVAGNPSLGGEVPGLLLGRGHAGRFCINIRGTEIAIAPPLPQFVVCD